MPGVLNLSAETRPGWLAEALAHLDEVLIDHANCEKKAASMAINFLFRYPDHAGLLAPLSALAREELRHFEQVLAILERRGIPMRRLAPSAYAGRLVKAARKNEPERCLDLMICAALIEARSCERMKLLHAAFSPDGEAPDPELARLYGSLLASEARHHRTYVDMAASLFGRPVAAARLAELSAVEAAVVMEPESAVRMHS
jgi:tRNA-(ms[2]io[6]A)-hydroxylase